MLKRRHSSTIVPSNSFYNSIAGEYDGYMTDVDQKVREVIRNAVNSLCPSGVVIDFGGGTGLDLAWLSEKHHVSFIEPSDEMRSVAKTKAIHLKNILIVEQELNFECWDEHTLPVKEKADLILMNLAVMNCISNISLLFKQLSLVSTMGTYIVATILNPSPMYLLKTQPLGFLKHVFRDMIVYNNHKGISHPTYVHKKVKIKDAAYPHFRLVSAEPIPASPFSLLILQKL
jgi:ubiquinone/menaquinone biosynthesis C-methylase UbiE